MAHIIPYSETQICKTQMLTSLDRNGFVILTGVLNSGQVDKALTLTWDDLEYMSPNLDRNDPSTWTTNNRPDDQAGMIQSMAGWTESQMYVRRRVCKVFKQLHGTTNIDLSADGLSFSGLLKNRRKQPNKKVHFDAGEGTVDAFVVQGVVNLIDQNKGDACFGCYPGSHKLHRGIVKGNRNWYALNKNETKYLEDNGCVYRRFPLPAGSVLLFRSQLAHCQAHPIHTEEPQKARIVHYVCGLPACDTLLKRKLTLISKRKAYDENRATTHYPNEQYSRVKLFNKRLGNGITGRYSRDISHLRKARRVELHNMSHRDKQYMGLISHNLN